MTLNLWAEQLLMGDRLEDKLSSPKGLIDVNSSPWRKAPSAPGRPSSIPIDNQRRHPFPKINRDSQEKDIGEALLFFANHELLAIELMALCLLRFPNAPSLFRKNMQHIIHEEQRHLKMYLSRAKELNVALGDIPMNGFFWNALSTVDTPMQFVTAMGLTLEQANLDHCQYFMSKFKELGDNKTAAILAKVYQDEIGHVQHGVQWHKYWTEQATPTLESHLKHLPKTLTPARAKGRSFDTNGRLAAGFCQDYIESIRIFRHSKGRPPNIYWFNPNAEQSMTKGRIPKMAQRIQSDLSLLPIFVAKEDDIVLIEEMPPKAHLLHLTQLGATLPQLLPIQQVDTLKERKLGRFIPWSSSPDAATRFKSIGAIWRQTDRERFKKSWGTEKLHAFLKRESTDWLSPIETVGRSARSIESLRTQIAEFARQGLKHLIFKADLSAAGRDRMRFRGTWEPGMEAWIKKTIQKHNAIVVEPFLEKSVDLSIQLYINDDGRCQLKGVTRFFTNANGQWIGHYVGPFQRSLSTDHNRFLTADGSEPRRFMALVKRLVAFIGEELFKSGHRGYAGIDAMLHRWENRTLFRPIVEINPRMTMGTIAIGLQKHISKNGVFWIAKDSQQVPFDIQKQSFANDNRKASVFPLTPKNTHFSAWLGVGDEWVDTWLQHHQEIKEKA